MARVDWEADRRRRMQRDPCTDAPPVTGSWADQARYGVFHGRATSAAYRSAGPFSVRSRAFDFEQLHQYARHATCADFRRKTASQRAEILSILRRLRARCTAWPASNSATEAAALALANHVLATQRH